MSIYHVAVKDDPGNVYFFLCFSNEIFILIALLKLSKIFTIRERFFNIKNIPILKNFRKQKIGKRKVREG